MLRTHDCGTLTKSDTGTSVTLCGWAHRVRNIGGLNFINLRDRSGVVQTVSNPEKSKAVHEIAERVRPEFVLKISGTVRARPASMMNPEMPTGEIEVEIDSLEILNEAKTPPFQVAEEEPVDDLPRMTYRYIDMRRKSVRDKIELRHRAVAAAREYLNSRGFWDIETPLLWKSTPEGANEYIVPSRHNLGSFYVLPQSPQLCKQILMVAGIEKYYQIARCFREEAVRADRQFEFTQIDIEMSFCDRTDVFDLTERMLAAMFRVIDVEIERPFPRISYADAMERYGSDKPDTRFDLQLTDLTRVVKRTDFKAFSGSETTKAIRIPGGASLSRKDVDDLGEEAKLLGAKGVLSIEKTQLGYKSVVTKFLTVDQVERLAGKLGLETGDLGIIVADATQVACEALGRVRLAIAKKMGLIDESKRNFLWVTDFPLFVWNEERKRVEATHHPFSMPHPEDLHLLDSDPTSVRGDIYDVVLNGFEIGGGSIRIHKRDIQERVFKLLGISKEEANEKFGFLLRAFEYGTPPHGGIAPGLDRIIALMAGEEIEGVLNIREVIAFPKTAKGVCPLTGAPTEIAQSQLDEYGIKLDIKEEGRKR